MGRNQRIDAIEKHVFVQKRVSLDALCDTFNVSKNTIRRDIDELCRHGNIKKIYGGVCLVEKEDLLPFHERTVRAKDAKRRIAARAAELVEDGDIIFVDSGTTTRHLIDFLSDRDRVTILSASLELIAAAVPYPNLQMICLSGSLNRTTISLVGNMASETLAKFNITKSFMASTGVTIDKGATNFLAEEYELKRTAMRQSLKKYLLIDKLKIGVVSMQTYADLKDFDGIITDAPLPDEYQDYLRAQNCTVTIADIV